MRVKHLAGEVGAVARFMSQYEPHRLDGCTRGVPNSFMDAPTPDYILSIGATLAVDCAKCRELRVPKDLALGLSTAGKGAVPVDQMAFRCTRCGGRGEPYVTGPGNLTLGRRHLWPPAKEG